MAKLGIDLGTSNSAAVLVFDADPRTCFTVEPIEGQHNEENIFPSYVGFDEQGKYETAGLNARLNYNNKIESVVRHFKRLIGRTYDYVNNEISRDHKGFSEFKGRIKPSDDGLCLLKVSKRDISVVEITSYLLKKILDDTQVQLDKWGEALNAVVITVPAAFDDSQRQATLAAAKMAGLAEVKIDLINEPTAAAIAKDLSEIQGNIMVIDVGGGTTDVVIGRMERTSGSVELKLTVTAGDDELGGIDMDQMILNYCKEQDLEPPMLKDILHIMNSHAESNLMDAIENAKINSSTGKYAVISTGALPMTPPKGINIPITEDQLNEIVSPIIDGYIDEDRCLKGIKCVVKKALKDLAGGNEVAVPRVIQQIDNIILIGGPCRMKSLRDMLKEIFQNNSRIVSQIENINPEDAFLMEGVAQGAALSQDERIEARNTVPYTLSILHAAGKIDVVHRGIPYERREGVIGEVIVPLDQGSHILSVLSQKGSSVKGWSFRRHIVNVPQEGELQISLVWKDCGAEDKEIEISGCGLPGTLALPDKRSVDRLGSYLERQFKGYLEIASYL